MSEITSFAGSVPANYEKYLGPVLFEPYALDLEERLRNEKLQEVLELACGTGRVTAHLVRSLSPAGKIIATDLNPDMIDVAKSIVSDKKVEWMVADAQDLPFEDNRFGHVVCQFGVMFFAEKEKAFAEAHRVLKPGGVFLFNVWDSLDKNPRIATVFNIMAEFLGEEQADFVKKGPFSFYDQQELRRLMEQAGFKDIRIEVVKKLSRFQDEESFLKGCIEGSPMIFLISEKTDAEQKAIRQRLKEVIVQQSGEYRSTVPLQAIVCRCVK